MYRGDFGEIVRRMRNIYSISQVDLAEAVGVTPGAISKIEGGNIPHKSTADAIIAFLGEEEFYTRYTQGLGYGKYLRRQRVQMLFTEAIYMGQYDKALESITEYKNSLRDTCITDQQRFLAMKQIYLYEAHGYEIEPETFLNIFELNRKFPKRYGYKWAIQKEEKLSGTELLIINDIAVALIMRGDYRYAYRLLCDTFSIVCHERMCSFHSGNCSQTLVTLCNNMAICCYYMGETIKAKKCCEYAMRESRMCNWEQMIRLAGIKFLILKESSYKREIKWLEAIVKGSGHYPDIESIEVRSLVISVL